MRQSHVRYKVETQANEHPAAVFYDGWRLFATYPDVVEAMEGLKRAVEEYPHARMVTEVYATK